MKEELLDLIPEFDLIKDEALRENTIQVWIDAMREGKWTPDNLKDVPAAAFIKGCPVNLIDHARAVAQISYEAGLKMQTLFSGKISLNLDHLVSGAILHDVGKLLECEKTNDEVAENSRAAYLRHPFSGVGIAFGKNIPDEVLHIIAAHSREGDFIKRSAEAAIVNKVDAMNTDVLRYFYE